MRPIDRQFRAEDDHGTVLASCGYETRSSFVCRLDINRGRSFAATYPTTGAPRELENRALYLESQWELLPASEALEAAVGHSVEHGTMLTVDISSMPRRFLADVIERITSPHQARPSHVRFLYCPGDFDQTARAAGRDMNLSAVPVSPYFSGAHRATSIPVGLVVGLGLEPHRALGIMELLEPARTWFFKSDAADERYQEATDNVNRQILANFGEESVFDYDLHSLEGIYYALESLAHAARLDYRLILTPSGPKIFSLACLLVAANPSRERPAVWRVGGDESHAGTDVEAIGTVVVSDILLDVVMRPVVNGPVQ